MKLCNSFLKSLDSKITNDARLMQMNAKKALPRTQITLSSDAQLLANKLMREDGEKDFLKFLAALIKQETRRRSK